MIKSLLVTMVLITTSANADNSKVCLPNDAGGMIVLTHQECKFSKVIEKFPFYAYATESDGTLHEGCFDIPSIADAKQQPGMRIIPVVNFVDPVDMTLVTFQAEWFTLEACTDETFI
jgi:hypothetical protein